jgi:hypothetical protein
MMNGSVLESAPHFFGHGSFTRTSEYEQEKDWTVLPTNFNLLFSQSKHTAGEMNDDWLMC